MSAEESPPTPLDRDLAALPQRDVDDWRAGRIRHQALAVLRREAPGSVAPWLRLYDRFLEPALVATLALVYLGWAVEAINRLHGQ